MTESLDCGKCATPSSFVSYQGFLETKNLRPEAAAIGRWLHADVHTRKITRRNPRVALNAFACVSARSSNRRGVFRKSCKPSTDTILKIGESFFAENPETFEPSPRFYRSIRLSSSSRKNDTRQLNDSTRSLKKTTPRPEILSRATCTRARNAGLDSV